MNVMILAGQEHIQLGYKAVLEIKGHFVTDYDPDCIIVDIGDDFVEAKIKTVTAASLKAIVYIVSALYTEKAPQTTDRILVLRGPVTAEALFKALD